MYKFEKLVKGRDKFIKNFPSYATLFDKAIEEANIFVFDILCSHNVFMGKPNPVSMSLSPIDMPFKICSFEAINEHLIGFSTKRDSELTECIECMLVAEDNGHLIIFTLMGSGYVSLFDKDRILTTRVESCIETREAYDVAQSCVYDSLSSLLRQIENMEFSEGIKTSKKKIKYKEKTSRKIGDVIYITSKKESNRSESVKGIEFSHRFLRRGHWRKLDISSIGKDRDGTRNQRGRTWVNNYEVGDKSLPIRKKIRVIKK